MRGAGGHRFYFVEKPPWIFGVFALLLFVNTFVGLLLPYLAPVVFAKASPSLPACESLTRRGVQYHAPAALCWWLDRSILIQFALLGLIFATFLVFHKRVEYIPPRR